MSRRIAFGLAVSLVLVASCEAPPQRGAVAPEPPPPQAHFAQVTAHPDDDLLFMNPDLAEGLRSGNPTTGIYLTAGEAAVPDQAGYGAARQEGTRAAYAQMARKPNEWLRGTMPVGNGRLAEVDALRADPDVKLVFLNLPEDANPQQGPHALSRLRRDPALTVTTTVPAGAAVQHPQPFDRRAVVESMTALFDAFQPTVVRLQDDHPDGRYQANWVGVNNHPDHVAGAALAKEALAAHRPRALSPVVVTYRDYNVADTPSGLSDEDKGTTREAFAAYVPHDVFAHGAIYRSWSDNSAYRWPRRGRWAARSEGGAVQAFSVRAHGLVRWTRTPQGVWSGPEPMPHPEPLRPQVSLLGEDRGQPVLVAQSEDGARILILRSDRSGNWPRRWEVVDAPGAVDPAQNGPPAAAVDADGRIVLAVKNAAGAVSIRRELSPASLRWEPWTDLGGADVQDGVSIVPDGGVQHVFAATRGQVLHWRLPRAGAAGAEVVPIGPARPAGALAERDRDGLIRLLVRTDRNGELVERTLTPHGWRDAPATSPGPGGIGDPVAAGPGPRGFADLVRVARDGGGHVHVADRAGAGWTDVGGAVTDHPAVVVEHNGAITLIGIGFDGGLVVNTGAQGSGGLRFAGWRPAVVQPAASVAAAD
ncbi:PIG-L family deacetylase [Saccharopolyspora sp. NPDC049357]|uniref:PIG-L family deacetylase n=1 Tax=Saccharopolyspora sp. NPDC049357 TaxID=3154507 RepID=UPI003444B241